MGLWEVCVSFANGRKSSRGHSKKGHTVCKNRNIKLSASLKHAVLERLGIPDGQLHLNGRDLGHLCSSTDRLGADLAQRDAPDIPGLNVLAHGLHGHFNVHLGVFSGRLKLIDPSLAPNQTDRVLDAGPNTFRRGVRQQARKHAAFDVEEDLVYLLRILVVVTLEHGKGVVVWRAVELAAVEVVAAGIESGLDDGKDFLVR